MTDANNILYSHDGGDPETISSGLLKAVLANDYDAWMRLSALFGPLVYYWCRVRGLQTSDAEDVVQEVFQTLVRRVGDFRRDGPGSSFRGWLKTITCNKVGDFITDISNCIIRPFCWGGGDHLASENCIPESTQVP